MSFRKEDQTTYAVWSFLSVFAGKMVKVDSQTSRLEDRSAMLKMNIMSKWFVKGIVTEK